MKKKARQPLNMLIVGETEVGKSYRTNLQFLQYVKTAVSKQTGEVIKPGRPVLIVEKRGEWLLKGYKGISYDPRLFISPKDKDYTIAKERELNKKRIANLRKITKNNIYVLLAKYKHSETVFSEEDVTRAVEDIVNNFSNGLLFIEDMDTMFDNINSRSYKKFLSLLTENRHAGLDTVAHLQTFRIVPPKLIEAVSFVRLHQTESVRNVGGSGKFTSKYEIFQIAQGIIDQRYKLAEGIPVSQLETKEARNNASYYVYINMRHKFILPPTNSDFAGQFTKQDFITFFENACDEYLGSNYRIYKHLVDKEDDKGEKVYENRYQAKRAMIEQFKIKYLMKKDREYI